MPADALLANTPKEQMHALTRRGFDPRKVVYLPVDRDPQYSKAKARSEASPDDHMSRAQVTYGMTIRNSNHTWDSVATAAANDNDKKTAEIAEAMSTWINENYEGEDNEWMQRNAQYINTYTIATDNPQNMGTVAHESSHQGIREAAVHADTEVNALEDELMARMIDIQTGTEEQARLGQKFIDDVHKGLKEKFSPEQMASFLKRVDTKFELLTKMAQQLNEGDK